MLSNRLATKLQKVVKRFFTHTYDWIDVDANGVEITTDEGWNSETVEDASIITDKPCMFLFEDISIRNIILHTPTLYVSYDDEINVGDRVTNVLDLNGTVVLESAKVETIDTTAELGGTVLKVVRLSGATTSGI